MCVFYDNTSAINLSKNPVQHSKSKHIEIWYHFIRDLVEEKTVYLEFITIDNQKTNIFTKPLNGSKFETLRKTIGVDIIPWTLSRVWTFLLFVAYLLHMSHMFLFVHVSFTSFCFALVFVDFCFLFYFWVCSKIQKPIKIEKSSESLIACLCVCHMWVWPSIFVLMA